MEDTHKVNRTAKFKKWVIMAFMTVLLALPMGSAFAYTSTPTMPTVSGMDNGYIYYRNVADGSMYLVTFDNPVPSGFKVYQEGTRMMFNNFLPYTRYTVTESGGLGEVAHWADNGQLPMVSVNKSTFDVYTSSSFTDVFFSVPKPPPPPAKMANLSTLADNVLATIVDGGILGTGLTILAIMLGVSLVPRLVRLFSH